ncbi:MAG: signal peptidase II [Alphaproteobacteria bacterium]|nr:signal peptidase II [Alphaproteobacteria bacterium]
MPLFLILSALTIAADQLSKWWVTEMMIRPALHQEASIGFLEWLAHAPQKLSYAEIPVLPFFNLVMVWNKGISFGLFNGSADYGPFILTLVAGAVTLWFVTWLFLVKNTSQAVAIALVIGGALGNMMDRVRFGAVIDFLDFHVLDYHWPAFNISDSAIVIGVFVLIFYALFFERRPSRAKTELS